MFTKKLSPREKKYFWTAVVVIFFALIYHFFIQRLVNEFKKVCDDTYLIEGKIKKSIYILSQSNRINKEYEQFGAYFREKAKSDDEEETRMSSLIDGKARVSGVSINNMKPYAAKGIKSYKNYSIEIEAESRIGPLLNFIYELESAQEMLKVEKLGLSVKEEGKPVFKVSMQISKMVVGISVEN